MARGRLSKTETYSGTFTNSQGREVTATLSWSEEKQGFVIRDKNRHALTQTAYPSLAELRSAGYDFQKDAAAKEMEPVA